MVLFSIFALGGLNEKLRISYYSGEYFKGKNYIKTILWSNKKDLSSNESINILVSAKIYPGKPEKNELKRDNYHIVVTDQ